MDIQKEREAFEAWANENIAKGRMMNWQEWCWEAWQAAKAESHKSASLYQFEINHLAAANQQWRDYAAKAQAVPEWISVEDRLPELEEHTWRTALPVNVMIDGYGQYLCYPCQYSNGVFYWADATYYGNDKGEHPIKCDRGTEVLNVTHWMPLPDAPQEPAND